MPASRSQVALERMLRWTRANQTRWHFAPADRILEATLARAIRTFAAAVELAGKGHGAQAAMLARSLYEDLVVSYWATWVKNDPEWVWERLQMQQEYRTYLWLKTLEGAIAARRETGLSGARLEQLKGLFGAHGEHSWWQREQVRVVRGDGAGAPRVRWRKTTLPQLVVALERFDRQLALISIPGVDRDAVQIGVRRLRYLSKVVNPLNNEHLHHSVTGIAGTYVDRDGNRGPAPSNEDWTVITRSSLHMTFEALLFLGFTRGNEALMREYQRQRQPFDSLQDEMAAQAARG
jgi:hypothetical protein